MNFQSVSAALAQPETVELPGDIPPLPDQRETDRPLYLSARNAAIYHELLLAPVAQWLKEGKFVARAIKSLPFEFSLSETWNAQSDRYGESTTLVNDVPAPFPELSALGLPFGRAKAINAEQDPRARARKILWNIAFASLPNRDFFYNFNMGWMSGSVRQRTASSYWFSRLMPSEGVIRADRFQFLSPAVVAGHAQLSHRPREGTQDKLWIHSSVSGKTREVLDSNRGDPIIGSLISMDDLAVFSGNIRAFDAIVLEERTMLVPFATVSPLLLSKAAFKGNLGVVDEGPAVEVLTAVGPYPTRSGETAYATWNADDRSHPQGAAWIPTSAVFVPRRVWVIELSKLDPYHSTGRQILVVDQKSMLPVYKVIYDRRGVYARTVAGGWTVALDEESDFRAPILGFMLVVDRSLQSATVLTSLSFQTLDGSKPDLARALLESLNSNKETADRDPGARPNSESEAVATVDDEAPTD